MDRIGRLELYRPPIENLIATKLILADARDITGIRFLMARHRPEVARIREIVAALPSESRLRATENLVYLEILQK